MSNNLAVLFCENSKRLKDFNYFCKKPSPQTFDRVLNKPLKISLFKIRKDNTIKKMLDAFQF